MSDGQNQKQQEPVMKEDLPELQSVIENIAKKEGYITYEITTARINSGGANYAGMLFEVNIKGKTKDEEKETNLFLKKAESEGIVDELVGASNVYATENYVYHELSKRFHELQIKANVPEEERYKMVKCYENSVNTTVILENLAKKAFIAPHRMDVVSLKYAELSMEQLAKFHALSFALKIKDADYFENKARHFKYPLNDDENAMSVWEMTMKMTVKNLDPINKAKAEKVIPIFKEKYYKYLRAENTPITCLCHGDFRSSNILMRKHEGEVAEVIPVDYQLVHLGCPVMDILFFVACGTDRKFRVQYLEHLKALYYDALTNFLKYFDINSNDVFPRKEMDELFHQRMDYIAMIAVFGFPFIFAPDNALDMKDLTESNINLDERFQERVIEILEDIPV